MMKSRCRKTDVFPAPYASEIIISLQKHFICRGRTPGPRQKTCQSQVNYWLKALCGRRNGNADVEKPVRDIGDLGNMSGGGDGGCKIGKLDRLRNGSLPFYATAAPGFSFLGFNSHFAEITRHILCTFVQ